MKKVNLVFICIFYSSLFGEGIPYGKEFLAYKTALYNQDRPVVAALQDGGFIICWNRGADYDYYWQGDIYGQLFDAQGTKKGGEFQVNTNTEIVHGNPDVAVLSGGSIVVCYEGYFHVYCQLLDAEGSKIGGEFLIGSDNCAECNNSRPAVAALEGGGFVICWINGNSRNYDIHGQLFDAEGLKNGGEFTPAWNVSYPPDVAALNEGGFLVCWEHSPYFSSQEIGGQLYNANTSKKGGEFQVNTVSSGDQVSPAIASFSEGGFFVCWASGDAYGRDVNICGQLYDADGSRKDGEFLVNNHTPSVHEANPAVSASSEGGFIVCWERGDESGQNYNIYGQIYDNKGLKYSKEFRVNGCIQNDQRLGTIAHYSAGGYVVCWANEYKDGTKSDIYAIRMPENPISHPLLSYNLIEPYMDVTLQSTTVYLKWQKPTDEMVFFHEELHYKILVDESPDFTSPQIIEQDDDTTLTLKRLAPGTTYFWKVLTKNVDGDSLWSVNTNAFFVSHTAGVDDQETSPEAFHIFPNHPNPFNAETVIRFELPNAGFVYMAVYDLRSRLVHVLLNENQTSGAHSVKWDGHDKDGNVMPSGFYICEIRIRTSDGRVAAQSVKMGLVR